MRKSLLFLILFVPFFVFSQVSETFSDGDFTNNPTWNGTTGNFVVNASLQLQSKAAATSRSYLTTPSEAFNNASWQTWVRINYNPTSSNYSCVYIISDRADVSGDGYGYYVQIGNTTKEVSLYVQEGTKKTKIIDGADNRVNMNPVDIKIKVTRDADGNFSLFSKLAAEADFVLEGSAQNNDVMGSKYFGVLFNNSSTTGNNYFFDDIIVSGEKFIDLIPPVWTDVQFSGTNALKLTFNEPMDFSNAVITADKGVGNATITGISDDKMSVTVQFPTHFTGGISYTITANGLTDLAGNTISNTQRQISIIEKAQPGDVVINEVLFDAAENSEEYFEVYNNSNKIIDLGKLFFTTRKTDGTLSAGYNFPDKTIILPAQHIAFTPNADLISQTYRPVAGANIITTAKWYTLNNSGGSILITNAAKDTVYDEAAFNSKWHHPLVKITKGVALEKQNPSLSGLNQSSWNSASFQVHYGTPGYKNSQFMFSAENVSPMWTNVEIISANQLKLSFSESMQFSNGTFSVDNNVGAPSQVTPAPDGITATLTFSKNFEKGIVYTISVNNLTDLSDTPLGSVQKQIALADKLEKGELFINEILFDVSGTSEYFEIYNYSGKVIDLSALVFTTRKTDGTLNTGYNFPAKTYIAPKQYMAFTQHADSIKNQFAPPADAVIVETSKWYSLSNSGGNILITNAAKDTIYDEAAYNPKWHHPFIKNTKNVSLEKINPIIASLAQSSWHSASYEVNYGTPGYKNSQYRDTVPQQISDKKWAWMEPESFSPDNDGINDVAFIRYKLDQNGYTANAAIFNAVGVKVAQIASNILLSTEGYLTWDGKNQKQQIVNGGIYVLLMEIINVNSGERKSLKLPVIVSQR